MPYAASISRDQSTSTNALDRGSLYGPHSGTNDAFRTSGRPVCGAYGRKFMTRGVLDLGPAASVAIAMAVMRFNDFSEGNDPRGEHDFGAFDYEGRKIFWKIDYYAKYMETGSPDPSDAAVTCRVMTILLADEY